MMSGQMRKTMPENQTSRIPGFYKLPPHERLAFIARQAGLTAEEQARLAGALGLERADQMIENVVGVLSLPLGIATR
jgi:hydroxymethylglutaryl-CoA reductase